MEEENAPHAAENIDFQMQGRILEKLVHDNNSGDADGSNGVVEEESNDESDQRNVDSTIEGQNYFALGNYSNKENGTNYLIK